MLWYWHASGIVDETAVQGVCDLLGVPMAGDIEQYSTALRNMGLGPGSVDALAKALTSQGRQKVPWVWDLQP